MHVTLIGGGWDEGAQPAVYDAFLREASAASARRSGAPRVAVVLLDEGEGIDEYGARFIRALRSAGDVEPHVVPVMLGDRLDVADLAEADGMLVGGGLTPEYAASLAPVRGELVRWLVERGAPYAGFSAGAAIAAVNAVVGGWRHNGQPVCPEDAGEDLDEVAVVAGLGLVPFTVDVHADAWETTPRLRAALSDLGEGHVGYALDENTALAGGQGDGRRARTGDADRRVASKHSHISPKLYSVGAMSRPSERCRPRPTRVQRRVARVPGDVRNDLVNVTHHGSPTT